MNQTSIGIDPKASMFGFGCDLQTSSAAREDCGRQIGFIDLLLLALFGEISGKPSVAPAAEATRTTSIDIDRESGFTWQEFPETLLMYPKEHAKDAQSPDLEKEDQTQGILAPDYPQSWLGKLIWRSAQDSRLPCVKQEVALPEEMPFEVAHGGQKQAKVSPQPGLQNLVLKTQSDGPPNVNKFEQAIVNLENLDRVVDDQGSKGSLSGHLAPADDAIGKEKTEWHPQSKGQSIEPQFANEFIKKVMHTHSAKREPRLSRSHQDRIVDTSPARELNHNSERQTVSPTHRLTLSVKPGLRVHQHSIVEDGLKSPELTGRNSAGVESLNKLTDTSSIMSHFNLTRSFEIPKADSLESGEVFITTLIDRIEQMARNGQSEIRLEVKPSSGERVTIRVKLHRNVVSGRIGVSDPTTGKILALELWQLKERLESQGFVPQTFEVFVMDDRGYEQREQREELARARSPQKDSHSVEEEEMFFEVESSRFDRWV